MNKIIKEQLKKVSFADLSNFDEKTNTYYIKKYSKPQYLIGHCYLIEVPGEIINNPNTVLATNWNNGRFPTQSTYTIYVTRTVGRMIYVEALAFDRITNMDLTERFSGYLDTDTLTQLKIL